MNPRNAPAALLPLVALTIVFFGSCSKEPTPEEKQADSTLALAKAQWDRGKYSEARRLLNIATDLDLRLKRSRPLAEEYSLLGRAHTLSASFDSSFVYLAKAIDEYKSLLDRGNARKLTLEVASLHGQMGEERTTYNIYAEALRLAAVFKDEEGAREIRFAMLPSCRALEKYEEAEQSIRELQRVYSESGNQRMLARLQFESVLSLLQRHEYSQTTEPLLRALTLADQAGDSVLMIQILSTLAGAYHHAGNTRQAFETYTDALTRTDRTSGAQSARLDMLVHVGDIYLEQSQYLDAARFYRAALNAAVALRNRLAEGYLFVLVGHCQLGEGLTQEATRSIQNALDLFAATGYLPGLAFANVTLGIVHQRAGRLNESLSTFKTAVDQMEHCAPRSADAFSESRDVALHGLSGYDFLTELLLKLNNTDDAFLYSERHLEHQLYERLSSVELRTRSANVNSLLAQLRYALAIHTGAESQLAKTLAHGPNDKVIRQHIQDRINAAEKSRQNLAAEILRAQPDLGPAVQFNGVTVADVQRLLPPGVSLLRNVLTSRSAYSFALTKSKATIQIAAVDRERLRNVSADYALTQRQLAVLADSPAVQREPLEEKLQDLASELYAALVRPVDFALTGSSKVLVATDPDLPFIPIHALRRSRRKSPFVIEQYPISYLPSLAMLRANAAPANPVRDIVGIGHPGSTSWDVEYELRDIRAFYKDARLYFGRQASLITWQLERGDILHLALDLRYSDAFSGNARFMLSDTKVRGISKEISWGEFLTTPPFPTSVISNLQADSVSVDGLLPSMFLINGSSAVIVNTLPATRKTKKFFGEIFYTTLLAGKTSDEAFRQALLEMIGNKEYASPYLWAPFTRWGK